MAVDITPGRDLSHIVKHDYPGHAGDPFEDPEQTAEQRFEIHVARRCQDYVRTVLQACREEGRVDQPERLLSNCQLDGKLTLRGTHKLRWRVGHFIWPKHWTQRRRLAPEDRTTPPVWSVLGPLRSFQGSYGPPPQQSPNHLPWAAGRVASSDTSLLSPH